MSWIRRFIFFGLILFHALSFGADQIPKSLPVQPLENSNSVDLKLDHFSKITVVFFWATWCAYCKEFASQISPVLNKKKDQIEIIGINTDEKKESVTLESLINYRFILKHYWLKNSQKLIGFSQKIHVVILYKKGGAIDTIYVGSEGDKMSYFNKRIRYLTEDETLE